ncbi:hypothetical protein TUM17576_21400 [Enterobacter hormaechei]|nr:hypothetical protein TUM17576_21400 [Enterobacter hormaechei]
MRKEQNIPCADIEGFACNVQARLPPHDDMPWHNAAWPLLMVSSPSPVKSTMKIHNALRGQHSK